MSRRKTVKINISFILPLIKSVYRSNVVFCEKMGRQSGQWVSDWQRNKNLPSPEEAVKMCLLLDTTPEDILTEPADIELVNGLIESEREKQGIKKERPAQDGTLSPEQQAAWELLQKMDDDTLRRFINAARAMLGE